MDKSKSLQRLTETADLVAMVEELLRRDAGEKLSAAAVAGARVTLRSIRESILSSHDQLAGDLVSQSRTVAAGSSSSPIMNAPSRPALRMDNGNANGGLDGNGADSAALSDPSRLQIRRRDLRNSIEKLND